jgi:hypothetical protein
MGVGLPDATPFNPNSFHYWNPNMGSQDGFDYGGTQWGQLMLEQDPQTFYYRMGAAMGVPDNQSAFAKWFKSQFPQFQQGYNAYTVSDPLHANLSDYAASLGGPETFLRQFQDMAPQLRGEDPGSRGGGPSRWVGR